MVAHEALLFASILFISIPVFQVTSFGHDHHVVHPQVHDQVQDHHLEEDLGI